MINIKYFKLKILLFFTLLFYCTSALQAVVVITPTQAEIEEIERLDPITQKALKKIKKTDDEIGSYGRVASELILHSSYLQDVWLKYLHDARNFEEYNRGMDLFEKKLRGFNSVSRYITTVFNFYTAALEPPHPEEVSAFFNGVEVVGFLNTFKRNQHLSDEERVHYFHQEYDQYLQDKIVEPFVLDEFTIDQLEPNTLYNFVLFPDGKIIIALEKPGERQYHVRGEDVKEAFLYPNHTILSQSYDQIVITAGSLILYCQEDKRLFFVSCKSGHFQPTYRSLSHMKKQLADFNIHPSTVICIPDVDMSRCVVKTYSGAKVPLLLTEHDAKRLFQQAIARFNQCYQGIDKDAIQSLSQGDMSKVNLQLIETLKKQRQEATYMRSAYHLFSHDHQIPEHFHSMVKYFGKLKDCLKHYPRKEIDAEKVQTRAKELLYWMDQYENRFQLEIEFADDRSLYNAISSNIQEMQSLLSQESLDLKEYHQLKKLSREMGALFLYMAQDAKWKGRGFFIYQTTCDAFLQINDLMAKSDYIYVTSVDLEKDKIRVKLPSKIEKQLTRLIDHLGVAPPSFMIEIDPLEAFWVINYAKDVYFLDEYVYDLFRKIDDGALKPETIDCFHFHIVLKDIKEYARIAQNVFEFLDESHKVTQEFNDYLMKINKACDAFERRDMEWIQKEARSMRDICYSGTSFLEKWRCTDQESFNNVLAYTLECLHVFQNEDTISKAQVELIISKTQALRDLVNLFRRCGVHRRAENTPYSKLPIVCYDTLEERADALIETLNEKKDLETIEVSPMMRESASFILSRIITSFKN